MKKLIPILLYFFCCSFLIFGQTQYNVSLKDTSLGYVYPQPFFSQLTKDGGAILVGNLTGYSIGPNGYYFEVTKVNSSGVQIWSKRVIDTAYHAAGNPVIDATLDVRNISELSDGSYVIAGESGPNSYSLGNKFLIKLSSTGAFKWCQSFLSAPSYRIGEVRATSDKGFIIAAGQPIKYGGNTAAFLMKLDSLGNKVWEKQVDYGTENDFFYSVTELSSGGFMACGIAIQLNTTKSGVLAKFDNLGNLTWSKIVPLSVFQYIDQLPSGDLLLTSDVGVMSRTDVNGNFQWTKKWDRTNNTGGTTSLNFHSFTQQKQILLSGSYFDKSSKGTFTTIAVDSTGTLQWAKKYLTDSIFPTTIYSFSSSALNLRNGSLLFTQYNIVKTDSVGSISATNCFYSDTIAVSPVTMTTLIPATSTPTVIDTASIMNSTGLHIDAKTHFAAYDPCSNLSSVQTISEPSTEISVYPNPVTYQSTLAFNKEVKNATVRIFDLLGKEIKTISFSGKQMPLDKAELKNGVYFVQVIFEKENTSTVKILIQ